MLANKDPLDSFLSLLELGIETNEDTQAAFGMFKQLNDEPVIIKIGKLHAARTPQEVAEALRQLDIMKEKAPRKGYLIDVFKGYIARNSGANADEMFLAALDHNPLLTGTYVDLGTYYKAQNRVDLAWDCFDLARRICPDHPTLNLVESFEKVLAERHPEYF